MKIQNNLQQIRWSKNMTVEQISKKSGLAKSTVSNIENENNIPSLLTAYCIAYALNEELESVFQFIK